MERTAATTIASIPKAHFQENVCAAQRNHFELCSDLHCLQLTSGKDFWYSGGDACDNKVFGYTGRPVSGHLSFASLADVSADWQAGNTVALNFYYAHTWGKTAIASIYPAGRNAQFGYAELVYHWDLDQSAAGK
jgi:hypothetical protein